MKLSSVLYLILLVFLALLTNVENKRPKNRFFSSHQSSNSQDYFIYHKKLDGRYIEVYKNNLLFHLGGMSTNRHLHSLGYYFPTIGHYYAQHGLFINGPEEIQLAPLVAANMVLNKLNGQEASYISSNNFTNFSAKSESVLKRIKYKNQEIAIGDIFFIPNYMKLSSEHGHCDADYGDVLWITHVNALMVTANFYQAHYYPGDDLRSTGKCAGGSKIRLLKKQLHQSSNFNKKFLNQALLKQKNHKKLIQYYFQNRTFSHYRDKSSIKACILYNEPWQNNFMTNIQKVFGLDSNFEKVFFSNTFEILSAYKDGLCDLAFTSKDFYEFSSEISKIKSTSMKSLNIKKHIYLHCNANNINKSSPQVNANFKVFMGPEFQDDYFHWNILRLYNKELIKLEHISSNKALDFYHIQKNGYYCLFQTKNSLIPMTSLESQNVVNIPIRLMNSGASYNEDKVNNLSSSLYLLIREIDELTNLTKTEIFNNFIENYDFTQREVK